MGTEENGWSKGWFVWIQSPEGVEGRTDIPWGWVMREGGRTPPTSGRLERILLYGTPVTGGDHPPDDWAITAPITFFFGGGLHAGGKRRECSLLALGYRSGRSAQGAA